MSGLVHTKLVTCRHRHHEHHNSKHSGGIFRQGHGQNKFLVCVDEATPSVVQYSCARQELGLSSVSPLLQLHMSVSCAP